MCPDSNPAPHCFTGTGKTVDLGFDLELPVQPLYRHGFQQIRVEKGMMTRVGGSHRIPSLLISCCVTNYPKLRGMKQLVQ